MNRKLYELASICFLSAITAFIVTPVFMIGSSPEDYSFISLKILILSGVLFSLIYFSVIVSVSVVLNLLKMGKFASLFPSFNLYWIVCSGLLFPLSVSTGMVIPEVNPVDKLNVLWVVILVFTLCMLTTTKIKKYVYLFTSIIILHSFTFSALSIYNSGIIGPSINESSYPLLPNTAKSAHSSQKLSKKENILVLSFDGIPGEFISKIIKENVRYAEVFKDFIVFENAVSQSPATGASLMGEIYGVLDYKSKGRTISQAKKSIIAAGLDVNLAINHIPDSYLYGYSMSGIKNMVLPSPDTNTQSASETLEFFKYPTIRIWTSRSLPLFWNDKIQKPIYELLIPKATDLLSIKLLSHKGANWDKVNIPTLVNFNTFISNLQTNDKAISLRYMHLLFTHFPVDFDEKCEYRSDDKLWYDSNQNERGIEAESICAIDVFINFIKKLQQLDIYENSLVIFKSDHGKPVSYFSTAPNNFKINGNKTWGYNRYRPALMVKGIGVSSDKVTFRRELVLLNDIARTTCESLTLNIECHNIKGVNLLGQNLDNEEPYYLYVPPNKEADHNFKNHISVKIPTRKNSLLRAMELSPTIDLSNPNDTNEATSKEKK